MMMRKISGMIHPDMMYQEIKEYYDGNIIDTELVLRTLNSVKEKKKLLEDFSMTLDTFYNIHGSRLEDRENRSIVPRFSTIEHFGSIFGTAGEYSTHHAEILTIALLQKEDYTKAYNNQDIQNGMYNVYDLISGFNLRESRLVILTLAFNVLQTKWVPVIYDSPYANITQDNVTNFIDGLDYALSVSSTVVSTSKTLKASSNRELKTPVEILKAYLIDLEDGVAFAEIEEEKLTELIESALSSDELKQIERFLSSKNIEDYPGKFIPALKKAISRNIDWDDIVQICTKKISGRVGALAEKTLKELYNSLK